MRKTYIDILSGMIGLLILLWGGCSGVSLNLLNDVPITFHGVLVDQHGAPVVGASVSYQIRVYTMLESTAVRGIVVSDSAGRFSIVGAHGESLSVNPEKAGYLVASKSTLYNYSAFYHDRFVPDPALPEVIKMWKKQAVEPLDPISLSLRLHPTDQPIYIDLLAQKVVASGGDLKVTIKRPPGEISVQHPQDWSVKIEAIDGGLIETTFDEARVTHEAPGDGYQPTIEVTAALPEKWMSDFTKTLFVRSRGGQVFSRLAFRFEIVSVLDDRMNFQFTGVANPNRSRNWEAASSH